jgi:hypothetical protein
MKKPKVVLRRREAAIFARVILVPWYLSAATAIIAIAAIL